MCLKAVLYTFHDTAHLCHYDRKYLGYWNKRDSGGPDKLAFHNEHIYHG